ncbi:helix-turn-helix domain-containing protein, partial [Janthinobacterium sp.]|uniref:helix-turn-helix domain-containing protein n=1 Tax=Janthinobacterium sp. TaxID=1871054 RepID=UPI00293D76A1
GPRTRLADVGELDILEAMESSAWQIQGAAQALGISRPSLYKLLDKHAQIRRAEAIPAEEIRAALLAHAGDLARCASALKTPSEALRRHLRIAVPAN